jgi:hypothetical protein
MNEVLMAVLAVDGFRERCRDIDDVDSLKNRRGSSTSGLFDPFRTVGEWVFRYGLVVSGTSIVNRKRLRRVKKQIVGTISFVPSPKCRMQEIERGGDS